MAKTAHRLPISDTLAVSELVQHADGWLLDGEIKQLSKQTLNSRRILVEKLIWFLRQKEYESCGLPEIRAFLAYLNSGHKTPEGRWGTQHKKDGAVEPRYTRPVSARTVQTYFINLKTLFRFLVAEDALETSPVERLSTPVARHDQVTPFTDAQVEALIEAARKSRHKRRDEAIVRFLHDTGCRASELCGLKVKDVDLSGARFTVLGKGNKTRSLYFGKQARKALWMYLHEEPREPEDPLFLADRGKRAGDPLTRSGLLQLIQRLGEAARIEACRASPHTFRHTFAVNFLRNGGNEFTLMSLLGHTSLTMTRRYAALADADHENQHRAFSPGDRLNKR